MSSRRNWTAIGLGLEVLAGVAVLIDPLLAIPVAALGVGAIVWGIFPDKIGRAFSLVFRRRNKIQPVTVNLVNNRRRIAETEIATLTIEERATIRQMLITGRAKNLSDQIWRSLEKKTSFVERDFTGPKGIKNEFRNVLEEVLGSNLEPVILAELETVVAPIGDLTPACAIRVMNTGPELKEKCLAQIEDHALKMQMPDPFVIRTEGQIRDSRTGRFTLSAGQTELIPILFRVPAHLGHFRFIDVNGKNYDFVGDSAEFVVAIYGAHNPTKVSVRFDGGQDFKPNFEMEYC